MTKKGEDRYSLRPTKEKNEEEAPMTWKWDYYLRGLHDTAYRCAVKGK